MHRKLINPPELAPPRGFNHAVLCSGGQTLFLAGQDASDGQGKIVATGDLVGQYEQILRNLQTIVESAGGTMRDIVKLTIFVSSRNEYRGHLPALGLVHRRYFGDYYPAMALFEVSGFFQEEALIELEGFAYFD